MAGGDITKADWIWTHVRLADAGPYLERQHERRAADLAVCAFAGVELPWLKRGGAGPDRPDQAIGQFCGKSCIEECTKLFGDGLANACRTCPN